MGGTGLICLGIIAVVFLSVGGWLFSAWENSVVCDYYPCDSNQTYYNGGIALSTLGSIAGLVWIVQLVKYLKRRKSPQENTSTASTDNNYRLTTPSTTQPQIQEVQEVHAAPNKKGSGFCGNCGSSVQTPFCTKCGCNV
jgi:hypothetical protein